MASGTPSHMPNTGYNSSPVSSPPQSPDTELQLRGGQYAGNIDDRKATETNGTNSEVLNSANGTVTTIKKAPRKKKELSTTQAKVGSGTDINNAPKEKKPRKPRDPNAPPAKRRKKNEEPTFGREQQLNIGPPPVLKVEPNQLTQQTITGTMSNGGQKPNIMTVDSALNRHTQSLQQPVRPPSSGQRYDPIRSSFTDTNSDKPAQFVSYAPVPAKAQSRASPSIASLLSPADPPQQQSYPPRPSPQSHVETQSQPRPPTSAPMTAQEFGTSAKPSPRRSPAHAPAASTKKPDSTPRPNPVTSVVRQRSSESSRSPAPVHSKAIVPSPRPAGSSTNRNPETGEREYVPVINDCIVIDVPMGSAFGSNYVNFMKEVEQKYGFDVAHPRLAEHRKRMRDVAALGAGLESGPESAGEQNLEVSDMESNAEMAGVDEDSAADGAKKKKRNMKNEYNKEDDFIDDTELAWEEQALASKDGYFVWMGPLVPESDTSKAEKADGAAKRGRGVRGGKAPAARSDPSKRGGGAGSRGGRGSRGGNGTTVARKSRVTKADKEKMDSDKLERERMAATVTKPVQYPG